MSSSQIEKNGKWEYMTDQGKKLKRRVGTENWAKADSPPPTGPPPLELKLVRQRELPGAPYHWSLLLAHEGQLGMVFQVRGDAVDMSYAHINDADVRDALEDSYIVAQPTAQQAERVSYWANHEPPPRAPNQAAVTENCQGWTIRVIGRLVGEGIIEQSWLVNARSLQQNVH